jgi:transposase-like protein
VFFEALRVKIRDEGVVRSKAVYLALGVLADGTRDSLGVWIEQTEGAKVLDEGLTPGFEARRVLNLPCFAPWCLEPPSFEPPVF